MTLQKETFDFFNVKNNASYFGDWINNIDHYNKKFNDKVEGLDNRFVLIDNFLNESFISELSNNFPKDYDNKNWFFYENPLEVKYLNSSINTFPEPLKNIFYILSTNQMVNIFSRITDIEELEYDPTLYGSSIQSTPKYGRLNIHLDYEKHPLIENKERRLNIILYLNKTWKDEWKGDTELWDDNMTKCVVSQKIKYNSAILFETNNTSWHGVPEKLLCPDNESRKTIAYYYISPLTKKNNNDKNKYGADETGYRNKASFIARPGDNNKEKLDKFYKIRPTRRITKKDIEDIWPEWNKVDY
jgi:hypothetical protein